MFRRSYQKPVSELSGVKTVTTPSGDKNLPSRTDKKKDQNYRDRPSVPSNNSYKEQALPITPKHEKRRDQEMVQKNGPAYNGPPASKDAPGGKTVHKDKVRTKSKPGDEYGHPYIDQGPAGMKGRRPLNGRHKPQRDQGGEAARYTREDYREHKEQKKKDSREWYRKNRFKGEFKTRTKRYEENPRRYKRRPGGYREPAKRTEDWREDNESKSATGDLESTTFTMSRGNPSQDSETFHDRGRGKDKQRKRWDERKEPLPNSYPYGFTNNNPGSAKVIPEGHGFANKSERVMKQARIDWKKVPEHLQRSLLHLLRTPLWKRFVGGTAREGDVVRWLQDQGWPKLDRRSLDALIEHVYETVPVSYGRTAATITDIEARCEPKLHSSSQGLKVKLKRVNAKAAMWTYEVQGSKSPYKVQIKAPRMGNVRDVGKLNVYVACSCPYWQWQGPEHHAKVGDYLYGKPRGTASKPDVKDPSGTHGACKPVLAVLGHLKGIGTVRKEWGKRGSVLGVGDWVINSTRKGIGAGRPERIKQVRGQEVLVGRVWVPRADVMAATPSYEDILGHFYLNIAATLRHRMKAGETFDEAVRRTVRLRGADKEIIGVLREYILNPDPQRLRRASDVRYLADSLAKGETRVLRVQRVAARYVRRALQAQREK
jgi:hypothetical protein